MTTISRMAQASDKVAALTAQFNLAAALHFDYLKVIRALNTLEEHLREAAGEKPEVAEWIKTCREFAEIKRADLNDYCAKKEARIRELQSQMENGVFDE